MTTFLLTLVGLGGAFVLARAATRASSSAHLRRLVPNPQWRLPDFLRTRGAVQLARAGIEVTPEGAAEIGGAVLVAIVALTLSLAPGLLIPALVMTIAGGIIGLRLSRNRAEQKFVVLLPVFLEQIATALRGGAAVGEALHAVTMPGALGTDLDRVDARIALGVGLGEALAVWPLEHPRPEVRATAGALAIAATLGGRSANALDGLAQSLRERVGARAEARALSAQGRLSAVVVGGAPIGFLAFSALTDPGSVGLLVNTGTGRICLVAGLALEGLGALWMRQIVSAGDVA